MPKLSKKPVYRVSDVRAALAAYSPEAIVRGFEKLEIVEKVVPREQPQSQA